MEGVWSVLCLCVCVGGGVPAGSVLQRTGEWCPEPQELSSLSLRH